MAIGAESIDTAWDAGEAARTGVEAARAGVDDVLGARLAMVLRRQSWGSSISIYSLYGQVWLKT